MNSPSFESLLDRAAALCGIEPEYWDIFGRHHVTTQEAKQTILRAMGWAAGNAEELERSYAERARREWQRLAPPSLVVMECDNLELPLSLPADAQGETVHLDVRREDGTTETLTYRAAELEQTDSASIDGRNYVRVRARLPLRLPPGYHNISAHCGSAEAATRYIVAPQRAFQYPEFANGGRTAGICIALYGLRSDRNWGCGDFRDLHGLIDWAADELHVAFVGLNPLHAIHNRRPYNTSPYLPNCIFYQNFLYLDIEAMAEYRRCEKARKLRESESVKRELDELRAAEFVEYERVAALKMRFLWLLYAQFQRDAHKDPAVAKEFHAFREREGDLLHRFALFCALDNHLHCLNPDLWLWTEWPAALQDPDSEETRAFAKKYAPKVTFFEWLQWQIDLQLQGAQQHARDRKLSIGLYHDLALATDRFGSDLWAHRPFFTGGCRVGAPPDDFAPQGQDWGFPPPNSQKHREDGYRLFAESIRKNCRRGGALRIDHVMRLFRLYWIPDGCDATQGAYVRETSEDYVRVLALESMRNQVTVVGEDLGTVEPEIRETLARFGILSYRLFFFEKNRQGEFRSGAEYPTQSLVSSTTHDLPTLAGFWTGADIEARRKAGVIDDAAYREQWAMRAGEKQKMLDRLFADGLLRPELPRDASGYSEWTGDLHY
ncbi:MAG TPA: 4-alpha-glucanotransferase, partial [Bryobacteraceae bacterium]|nr:4-alpha-glucanotransferase [Bryobacteraceae bacterium]